MLAYLDGAIAEAIGKARKLKTKIPGSASLPPDFEPLSALAEREIDAAISELVYLQNDPAYHDPANVKQKISSYRQVLGLLSILENVVVAAIARSHRDDEYVNQLLRSICREIGYPIQKPVASCLSRTYYHIYSEFNLMCMPLLESDFLLHIADIYHELGHPLLGLDNPKLEPFQSELGKFNVTVKTHFAREIARYERNTTRDEPVKLLYIWRDCWIKKWSVEFFCDLFGLYTLGPAYAWSHFHLCVKTSSDVFDVPLYKVSSHPPDDARMQALLHGLELLGYKEEKKQIKEQWEIFKNTMQQKKKAEYNQAIPNMLLEGIAVAAYNGVIALSCQLAKPDNQGVIATMLNEAWSVFWEDPATFVDWEKNVVSHFKAQLLKNR